MFDPLTYDPSMLDAKIAEMWSVDPDLILCTKNSAHLDNTKNEYDYFRAFTAFAVSPSVLALGKNPYPKVRTTVRFPVSDNIMPRRYDNTLPWCGKGVLLRHITPDELNDLGCINTNTDSGISPQFQIDAAVAARASDDIDEQSMLGNHDGIHPIFRRSNFLETSDLDYECIKPSLRIATKMLEMETVLDFLHALGAPLYAKPGTQMQPGGYFVYYTGESTEQERAQTVRELIQMADFVTFEWFNAIGEGAATTCLDDKPGLRAGGTGHASAVAISNVFRYILKGGDAIKASSYNPAATDESALLRTQLLLAVLLVHELGHAWWFNTTSIDSDVTPYCNDHRISEEGHALEIAIIRGVHLETIRANVELETMPFGMRAIPFPGTKNPGDIRDSTMASYAKYGTVINTEYAVTMKFVKQFFSDEFWDLRQTRYGSGAFTDYAAVGVRYFFAPDHDDFDPSETPTVDKTLDENLGYRMEEWMPDVIEDAIIYRDKAVSVYDHELNPGPA